MVLLTVTHH